VGKQGAIELEAVADLPDEAVAIVGSPSDPLGSLLYPAEAVRLARACKWLIVDERFAEYAGFSLLPLAAEFDNIVVLRTFETWAALGDLPCAWARGSSRTAEAIGLVAQTPSSPAMAAALATLGDMPSVDATLRLVREERSRLYRLLRKFTFLEPIPSWGPFLSARVRLVSRDKLVTALLARGIHVHAPDEIGLEHVVRIALGSRLTMDRLRLALIDLAPEMVS
jgi:histidinol-phosphate aminotransferase